MVTIYLRINPVIFLSCGLPAAVRFCSQNLLTEGAKLKLISCFSALLLKFSKLFFFNLEFLRILSKYVLGCLRNPFPSYRYSVITKINRTIICFYPVYSSWTPDWSVDHSCPTNDYLVTADLNCLYGFGSFLI